jgi:hypothetical protein
VESGMGGGGGHREAGWCVKEKREPLLCLSSCRMFFELELVLQILI